MLCITHYDYAKAKGHLEAQPVRLFDGFGFRSGGFIKTQLRVIHLCPFALGWYVVVVWRTVARGRLLV